MKWHHVKIKEIANVVSGFGFPIKYQGNQNEEFPFFKVGDMNLSNNERYMTTAINTISEHILKKLHAKAFPCGTIIFPKIGAAIATNKKRILTRPSVVDNNVMGLIPKSHINENYLYFFMQQFDLRSVSNIGPVPSIRKSEFEKVLVPLPPLSEQRRIVEILDQADALRKKRAEADAKAAKILPALFYKMFGDPLFFASNTNSLQLRNLNIEFQNGFACGEKNVQDGIPHLRMNNIDDKGILNLDLIRTVPQEQNNKKYRLYNSDVLFMSTNSEDKVGKTCVFYSPDNRDFLFSNHLTRIKIDDDKITPEYLASFLHLLWVKKFYPSISKRWVNQATVMQNSLKNIYIYIPDKEDLIQYTTICKKVLLFQKKNFDTSAILENLFNNLLYKAFSGELTAKWREAHIKELLAEMEHQSKLLEEIK